MRNAGGAVGPNLDSLIALDYFLGTLEDVLVVQHTGKYTKATYIHGLAGTSGPGVRRNWLMHIRLWCIAYERTSHS